MAATLNDLLQRLGAAFEAERSFAANAAHELRTPLAGAIAQAQRLQSETRDPVAKARASEIEATLKRLTRLSERLMQLARAEGSRLLVDRPADLRPVARILTEEFSRVAGKGRISLALPEQPVMSNLDPDAFAIVFRNLVENALRHGAKDETVDVSLTEQGKLTVSNAGHVVPMEEMARLTNRFERAGKSAEGSGLGLSIVAAIAERIGAKLVLRSPRAGQISGMEVVLTLPVANGA
jgi:two-component system OmpR family sensor kinase